MGERSGAYRVLVGKPEGKRPLGRARRRWEDKRKANFALEPAIKSQRGSRVIVLLF
jgi:hypothetical protein